jgi:predicted GNAT family acetyltransferase
MSTADDYARAAAFRSSFARRQAGELHEIRGGFVVLDPRYPGSREDNQVVVDGALEPADLPGVVEAALAHLDHRQVSVLDDAVAAACAPALTAAGYDHATELVMIHSGAVPKSALRAHDVELADLAPTVYRLLRSWLPDADESTVRQLVERRAARLRGAEKVSFLAVRNERGTIVSWADLYIDSAHSIGQIEDVITADGHHRRGYADALLTTAIERAADSDATMFFLLADPDDWPQTWYARRGFSTVGRFHKFSRADARAPGAGTAR